MRHFPLLLLLCGFTQALKSPMVIVPLLAGTAFFSKKSSPSSGKFELPPIEVGVKLDFEVNPRYPKKKKGNSPPPPKVPSKKVVKKSPPPPKVKIAVVPPPPPKKKVAAPQLAAPKVMVQQSKKPSKTLLLNWEGAKPKVGAVLTTEDKILKVMWATFLFVLIPMDIVLFFGTDSGKEFLIDIFDAMPEQVPAQLVVLAIADGLLVGIFGACFVATVGPFLVEGTQRMMSRAHDKIRPRKSNQSWSKR
jgi:hypothetical protein